MNNLHESIEPRLSVLEKGQENLQNNLLSLAQSVDKQGAQLETALVRLSEKIDSTAKTDWTTFWTMIATLLLLLGAVSTPVWIYFGSIDKQISNHEISITKLNDFTIESIKNRAELTIRSEYQDKTIERLHNVIDKKNE